MKRMLLNVIHRADRTADRLEVLQFQQAEAQRHGLRTTILVTYGALFEPQVCDYVAQQASAHGTELGLHLHELVCDDYRTRFGTEEKAIYLLPSATRYAVIRFLIGRFREVFGRTPQAIGSYILDAATLNFLRTEFPEIRTAIVSCFEEGLKMYHGNNRQWHLFSEGGPWGIYQPSRNNHLCPAKDEADAVGIVALPHLNRDMVLSLTSRDDLFASHPVNLVRAMANDGDRCDYLLHFIDQWLDQLNYNDCVYYSLFVSPPWLAAGHPFSPDPGAARRLYGESLAYLADRRSAGLVCDQTVSETGEWYRQRQPLNRPEVNLWRDILCGSRREMFWYVDAFFRLTIDLNAGGTLCDLRPLAGQVDGNMGADTKNLWNGNYPYLISSEHRGGVAAGPRQTAEVRYRGARVAFSAARTTGRVTRGQEGGPELVTEPLTLNVGDVEVTVASVFRFPGGGVVEIERRLLAVSDPSAKIELAETHRGCWGTTEYPEDMRGIVLAVETADQRSELVYAYGARPLRVDAPKRVSAALPSVRCEVALEPAGPVTHGEAGEGFMFQPFYTLTLSGPVTTGESLKTRLILRAP
ncbi:MAG TPA: hypothetical protein VNR00_19490 [Opitutus sp.]|nr:hypothetical protein [Opitutus sp.]